MEPLGEGVEDAAGRRERGGGFPPFLGADCCAVDVVCKIHFKMHLKMSLCFTEFVFRENVVPNSVKAV